MGSKLYVGNLSYSTSETALRSLFERDDWQVQRVSIVTDRATGRSRGFGFVEMASAEQAQAAIEALDGQELDGRSLKIKEAIERGGKRGDSGPRRSDGRDGRGGQSPPRQRDNRSGPPRESRPSFREADRDLEQSNEGREDPPPPRPERVSDGGGGERRSRGRNSRGNRNRRANNSRGWDQEWEDDRGDGRKRGRERRDRNWRRDWDL